MQASCNLIRVLMLFGSMSLSRGDIRGSGVRDGTFFAPDTGNGTHEVAVTAVTGRIGNK